jgi:hypothetical protein
LAFHWIDLHDPPLRGGRLPTTAGMMQQWSMPLTAPVSDWTSDFDVLDPQYVVNPFTIWDDLRARCPIAHTKRRGSNWLPTLYDDVTNMAHDIEHFSSSQVLVIPIGDEESDEGPDLEYGFPPIGADPPLHTWTRRLLLPWFSHARVKSYVPLTRSVCTTLLDGFADGSEVDAAVAYAQQIPVRVIAKILGVPTDMSDTFTQWVRDFLEFADDAERRIAAGDALLTYFVEQMEIRRHSPGDDLLSELLQSEVNGEPVDDGVILGMAAVVLIAGVDTTWSAIGSSLWHLSTHPDDLQLLVEHPEMMTQAIEELLRAYSPVTMARVVTEDIVFGGCPMKEGDKVLMNFPAANRDPEAFADPDRVDLNRTHNRHVAFGSGIHRCAGSNLARMELKVALEEWIHRIPTFTLDLGQETTWAGGQVRGPRTLPVVFR